MSKLACPMCMVSDPKLFGFKNYPLRQAIIWIGACYSDLVVKLGDEET